MLFWGIRQDRNLCYQPLTEMWSGSLSLQPHHPLAHRETAQYLFSSYYARLFLIHRVSYSSPTQENFEFLYFLHGRVTKNLLYQNSLLTPYPKVSHELHFLFFMLEVILTHNYRLFFVCLLFLFSLSAIQAVFLHEQKL